MGVHNGSRDSTGSSDTASLDVNIPTRWNIVTDLHRDSDIES